MYRDITGNALATYDRKDLFESLNENELKILIWINQVHLNTRSWTKLIPNESFHEIVLDAHLKYYFME